VSEYTPACVCVCVCVWEPQHREICVKEEQATLQLYDDYWVSGSRLHVVFSLSVDSLLDSDVIQAGIKVSVCVFVSERERIN